MRRTIRSGRASSIVGIRDRPSSLGIVRGRCAAAVCIAFAA
jgi:hypothetical protein